MLDFELKKTIEVQKKRGFNPAIAKTNVVEHGQSSKNKKTKVKPKLGLNGVFSRTSFKGNVSTVARWVTDLWIVDF